MNRFAKLAGVLPAACAVAAGCTGIGDYSTVTGECYHGEILKPEFVRSESFDPEVELTLTLDANALGRGDVGAMLTTSDGRFRSAPVQEMAYLRHDSLSELQFPGGRVRNYIAYAPANDGLMATVVISLMENEDLEVRIMRPDESPEDGVDETLFGVFHLVRKDDCQAEPPHP